MNTTNTAINDSSNNNSSSLPSVYADNKSLPIGSLDAYIYWVNQIPMLSAQEEKDLATQYHGKNDLDAAKKLVASNLRYVVRISQGYSGYGLPQADLIQEGNIGLMKAVKRFNPNLGIRLISFAVHWVKAEIHEFVLRNWRIVKVATTKAQRKLFFNLRRMTKNLGWVSDEEVNNIAKELNVSQKDVRNMEMRFASPDVAFDGMSDDEEENWNAPANYLEDNSANPDLIFEQNNLDEDRKSRLGAAFANLDDMSKDIITSRWLSEKKSTLHELARKYNLSAERIRQLEKGALNKLKKSVGAQ